MIFAIGPVQEFIATARRSRDLWYGSWMLSELSKAAANKLESLVSLDNLVFPNPADVKYLEPNSQFNSPNKIVAVVDDPQPVVVQVREAVDARLRDELWADAKIHINGHPYNEGIADQQIDDLLEFYWVSVPFNESNDTGYAEARETAEMLMAARKTTRDFEQPEWSAGTPKSSLDGARESVIPKSEYPERGDPSNKKLLEQNKQKIEDLYKRYRARRGEQLSGVDLLKRLGRLDNTDTPKFKSTSDMAALPFVQKFNQKSGETQTLIEALRAKLPPESDALDGVYEGLVFESRYADGFPSQELTRDQLEDYLCLLEKYAGKVKPNPYYALLAADGDFMGKVIDEHKDIKSHQDISKSLAEFAQQAQEIVKTGIPQVETDDTTSTDETVKNLGVPIYTGGDDVLAYLPLHTALKCARELEATFRENMDKYAISDAIRPTLSIGIVIVHHLEPLSDALQQVRKAEKDAKAVDGKNGLAIILSKRSGVDRAVSGTFNVLYDRLDTLMKFSRTDAISGGTAYELQKLHRILSKTDIPAEGQAGEAIRIIARKRESGGEKGISPEVKQAFEKWIRGEKGIEGKEDIEPIGLNELAREMIVAKTLAGKEEAS